MTLIRLAAAALALLLALPASAQIVARATSPDGALSVEVGLTKDGRAEYAVSRRGRPVVTPSRLGFILADQPKIERFLRLVSAETRDADATWEQPWGERRFVRDRHRELRVRLEEAKDARRRFDVVFRLFEDGIGFRYEFPDQPSLRSLRIQEELTEFNLAENGTAWWLPGFEWLREEYLYNRTSLSEVGVAQTPFTARLASGLHVAIHEAALVDYAGMNLAHTGGTRFRAALTPSATGPKVVRAAPFPTPWRTIQIGERAVDLANSDIVLNLNEPNKLGDVSWVRPCKYTGIWWDMHLETRTWSSGPKHGATTADARRLIDFTAKHGLCGMLVEGWNTGWDADWSGDGSSFSFMEAYPDFDLAAVAAHARRRGVHLIGHHETAGNVAHYEAQLVPALDLYQKLGVDMLKTGYVAHAGGVRARGPDGGLAFEWHEGQVMARHHLRVVEEAAKRRIAVNAHEPIKDTGLRRTYPNWVSREGARGMEFNAWGDPPNPPEHEANLFFTRLLAGPMDFTPGVVSLRGKGGRPIPSTLAKQLALYVAIYSPVQTLPDAPKEYLSRPAAFDFIKAVPVDWAESRAVAGEVGEYAVVARRGRTGGDWWLGAVGGAEAREVSIPLDFLAAGRRYRALIHRDGDRADWRAAPQDMVVETRELRAGDTLTLRLAAGGGGAVRFVEVKGR